MPQFSTTRQISAPVEDVWAVLDQFGDIARWSSGVRASSLTSTGPVGQGATRHCDLAPFGSVEERIGSYTPNRRMEIAIFATSKLPISKAVADFHLSAEKAETEVTVVYSYTLNRLGSVARGTTEKRMRKAVGGLVDDLKLASEDL